MFNLGLEDLIEKPEPTVDEVIEFLDKNPNPEDEELHKWAEEKKFEVDDVEELVYVLATAFVKFLKGGRAAQKGFTADKLSQGELNEAIAVEVEHVTEGTKVKEEQELFDALMLRIQTKIGLDHYAESIKYYIALKEMEKKLKEEEQQEAEKGKGQGGQGQGGPQHQGGEGKGNVQEPK